MKPTMTQNKCVYRRTAQLIWSLVLALFLVSPSLWGQVTVGTGDAPQDFSILEIVSNGTGGLRLPLLDSDQREILEGSTAFQTEIVGKGKGLTIYNTSIDCVEYWNSSKWISLCSGNSAFTGGECADTLVAPTGGSVSCSVTDPNCETAGEYTFTFVSDSDFASIEVTDAGAGTSTVSFDDND